MYCRVYSVYSDDGQRYCPKHVKSYSKNKFENLVFLFGFIIRMLVWSFAKTAQLVQKLIWRETRTACWYHIPTPLPFETKGKVAHWHDYEDLARGRSYSSNPFATSALEGTDGQYHAPFILQLWRARRPSYRGLGGRRGRSGQARKNMLSPGFDYRTIHSVACHYTDEEDK